VNYWLVTTGAMGPGSDAGPVMQAQAAAAAAPGAMVFEPTTVYGRGPWPALFLLGGLGLGLGLWLWRSGKG